MNYEDSMTIRFKKGSEQRFKKITALTESIIVFHNENSPERVFLLSNITEIHFWYMNWKFHLEIDTPTFETLLLAKEKHYLQSFFVSNQIKLRKN